MASKRPAKTRAVQTKHPQRGKKGGKLLPAKYDAMRAAMLKVLSRGDELTWEEIVKRVTPHLPRGLFRDEGSIRWHSKWVQLDLEAHGVIDRIESRPLRFVARKSRRS